MKAQPESPNPRATTSPVRAGTIEAAVVRDGADGGYQMFDSVQVTGDEAFFAGRLFLEVDEQFTVEFRFADRSTLRVAARVSALVRGDQPGMKVALIGLGEADRRKLSTALSPS